VRVLDAVNSTYLTTRGELPDRFRVNETIARLQKRRLATERQCGSPSERAVRSKPGEWYRAPRDEGPVP
jgi:hypothetical protein